MQNEEVFSMRGELEMDPQISFGFEESGKRRPIMTFPFSEENQKLVDSLVSPIIEIIKLNNG